MRWWTPITLAATGYSLAVGRAQAHAIDGAVDATSLAWTGVTLVLLGLAAWLYARGLHRLWTRAQPGAGIHRWRAAVFAVGWITAAIALLPPIDTWGQELFAMHMVQHEILMLVSAPLLVLGQPAVVFLWAFPRGRRRGIGQSFANARWRALWSRLAHPLTAWSIYTVALWGWHIPALFEAAILRESVHVLQHISFFGAALLFWWTFLEGHRSRVNGGIAVVAIFTTAIHSSLLGALLTFSPVAWYAPYLHTAGNWGLTALEDQQLGGLIMWVPGGVIHLLAGLAVMARWIGDSGMKTTSDAPWPHAAEGEGR